MKNNFISITGCIFNTEHISYITVFKNHRNTQFYFRIYTSDTYKEIEFEFLKYGIKTQDDINQFYIKLDNEHKRLETYLLDGGTGSKKFFVSINLKK